MIPIRYTRNFFLRAICVVYLFSFVSFYVQIPGLYGNNGILPVKSLLENSKHKTLSAKVHYQPTLLWLAPYLGLDTQYALDVIALLGSFLAFTGFVSQKFCTIPLFAGLWSLYFSLYQVGQVFLSTEFDNLLLEAGFLCLLVAPLLPSRRRGSKISPRDNISLWLVKWLLFRYFFTTGLIKLISACPKWWDLSALTYHFQSMVLPSPLSWYAHHLPTWILRLTVVFINASEIVLPLLFFVPVRSVRITGFVIQMFLQIFIVLTGNFNFANLLVVTLLISLLDDYFFFGKPSQSSSTFKSVMTTLFNVLVHAGIVYLAVVLYKLTINGTEIHAKIGFTKDDFNTMLKTLIMPIIFICLASLAITILKAIFDTITYANGGFLKIFSVLATAFYACLALLIFAASTVPLTGLHTATNSSTHPQLRTVFNRLGKLHIVHGYGAGVSGDVTTARMTGTEKGRLEIVIEGASGVEGPWQEYQFMYKPGNVNHSLPFVAPYSPRLDWQLWHAAQTTYDKQPWLLSLCHRLLEGKPQVLALLDGAHSPRVAPKYVRAQLYRYKYTAWPQRDQPTWWKRELVREYFPAYTRDSAALVDYLRARALLPVVSTGQETLQLFPVWKQLLEPVRKVTGYFEATLLLWSVFSAGCAIITTTSGGGGKVVRK